MKGTIITITADALTLLRECGAQSRPAPQAMLDYIASLPEEQRESALYFGERMTGAVPTDDGQYEIAVDAEVAARLAQVHSDPSEAIRIAYRNQYK